MARDFGSAESSEIEGILGVFPNFSTAGLGQKTSHVSRRRIVQRFPKNETAKRPALRSVHLLLVACPAPCTVCAILTIDFTAYAG